MGEPGMKNLPPGWVCKYDVKSGNCYYFNHLTKDMSLEDPRIRMRQLQQLQPNITDYELSVTNPMHGSPYHVYPANNHQAVPAFHGTHPTIIHHIQQHFNGSSPKMTTKSNSQQMEMTSKTNYSVSPHMSRIMSQLVRQSNQPQSQQLMSFTQQQQETSFINAMDTEAAVGRINTMFPTANDDHIRLLMKKYLKNIFPKADETLLLDTLANADDNVQHASEHLMSLGFDKRDTTVPKVTNRNREEQVMLDRQLAENRLTPKPKVLNKEEKQEISDKLQAQFEDIPYRIITMALESVEYSEDRAYQILQIVMQDDNRHESAAQMDSVESQGNSNRQSGPPVSDDTSDATESPAAAASESTDESCEIATDEQTIRKSKRVRAMTNSESYLQMNAGIVRPVGKMINSTTAIMPSSAASVKASMTAFQSRFNRIKTNGPKAEFYQGPNEDLLLVDYVAWNGANPDMQVGQKSLARGPDRSLLRSASAGPIGPKSVHSVGAQVGLAKGSIYSSIARVKCNVPAFDTHTYSLSILY